MKYRLSGRLGAHLAETVEKWYRVMELISLSLSLEDITKYFL